MLLVDSAVRGVYSYKFFAENYPELCSKEDAEILRQGLENDNYLEAWESVCKSISNIHPDFPDSHIEENEQGIWLLQVKST